MLQASPNNTFTSFTQLVSLMFLNEQVRILILIFWFSIPETIVTSVAAHCVNITFYFLEFFNIYTCGIGVRELELRSSC